SSAWDDGWRNYAGSLAQSVNLIILSLLANAIAIIQQLRPNPSDNLKITEPRHILLDQSQLILDPLRE
ncbi:MAG TPA: hypothetical protein V6D27_13335, partial [Vampirovibrionales bacterium]